MKNLLALTIAVLLTSNAMAGIVPTADSFGWTLYDNFNTPDSYDNWYVKGYIYNMSTYYSLDGKMVHRPTGYPWGWESSGRFYAFVPDEDVRGIKADIALKANSYLPHGSGQNVIGIRVAENLDVYMGFFSSGYTHTIQVGYRLNGEDIIPEDWASQTLTFGQEYEAAIVLDDSGNNLLFFVNNQLFEMVNVYPAVSRIDQFFIETNMGNYLNVDYTLDNYCVLIPEPATMLLLGIGGILIRKKMR